MIFRLKKGRLSCVAFRCARRGGKGLRAGLAVNERNPAGAGFLRVGADAGRAYSTVASTQMVAAVMPPVFFEMTGSGPRRLNTPVKRPLYRYRPDRLV